MFKFRWPWHNPFNLRQSVADNIRQRLFGVKRLTWHNFRVWSLRILVGLAIFILLLFAWYAKDLPTPGKIKNRQAVAATQLFDRNGKPIYAFHGDVKRVIIDDKNIPDSIKKATITAEDRGFYRHIGIDFKGIIRAAYNVVVRRQGLQSGSTITQQYVKNALLDQRRTMTRKIKEIILSLEIEIMYSKDQILTMYLNEIPYGSNAYGVQAAAQTFFNKDAKDLTLAESATLAALPQRPTYYSPYGAHPDRRLTRVQYILDSMADLKYISREEANKAKEEAKNIKFAEPREYIVAPHFAMYVKDQLVEKYGEQVVNEGGLKVTTTLDLDKQILAESAVKESADRRFDNINASNAALVSIDPKNGQILAMVGSVDFFNKEIGGQVNVADAQRQPGSAFKPIVYATAFKDKYNPASILWDVTTDFGGYTPKNYDGATHGPVTMRQALAGSLNIPAVKTLYLAGLDKSLRTAHDMGITTLNDRDRYGLSLVLGGGEVKLVDLTTAYGVFANNGRLAPTTPILKVENGKGKVLEEYKEEKNPPEVLDPQIAYEISSILSDNDARSYVFGSNSALAFFDRQVAAKTGTTSEYRDAWTVGYTPQVVTGVWVGNNDNSPMSAGAAGAMAAAPIWHKYMASVLTDQPKENFVRPAGIAEATVDKLSNKLPNENSPETLTDIFASWQAPKDKDDIHIKIRIDKTTGKRATDYCPNGFTETKTYTNLHSEVPSNPNWENPVRAAAAEFGINVSYPPAETSCGILNNKLGVKITSPANNATLASNFTIAATLQITTGVKKLEFMVDNKTVGTDTAAPYTASASGIGSGKHNILVMATDASGATSADSITIQVGSDATAPGAVSLSNIQAGAGEATLTWKNPADKDLKSIQIYQSIAKSQLGNLVKTVNATPGANSSTTINNLTSGKTYWFTLRAIDKTGNENDNLTQHEVKPQ